MTAIRDGVSSTENEKDRSDKKNEFAERGAEDFYFAAKDREIIEETRVEMEIAASAAREERARTCPKCAGNFESHRFMEFVVERCRRCEGIWLNKGQLEIIFKRAARGPVGAFLDRCFSKGENDSRI
jgi:Zn-finger nucleic acid-binding protein